MIFKTIAGCVLLLAFIWGLESTSSTAQIQATEKRDTVYIAKFKGDRQAAVCYSFDDGIKDQFELAYPMLIKHGLPATFFIIPSQIRRAEWGSDNEKPPFKNRISEEQLKIMTKNGMEIANHSWSHSQNLTKLNDKQLSEEIDKADSAIFKLTGQKAITFAYPWNAFDKRTQSFVLKKHVAAREFQFGIGTRFTTEAGNNWVDGLIRKKGWGIAMIHSIASGFDSLSNPIVLDKHFEYVKQHNKELWVTTFKTLSLYNAERDSSTLSTQFGNKSLQIKLSNSLPQDTYNEPLTIIIVSSSPATNIIAKQGSKKLPVRSESGKMILDALPNGQDIIVSWK